MHILPLALNGVLKIIPYVVYEYLSVHLLMNKYCNGKLHCSGLIGHAARAICNLCANNKGTVANGTVTERQ